MREANARLGENPVTRELVRLFFLSEAAKKAPPSLGAQADPESIRQAAVIGAGAMGAGIALLMAGRGIWTRLKDLSPEFVSRGMKTIRKLVATDVARRRITPLEATQRWTISARRPITRDCATPIWSSKRWWKRST